MKNNVTYKNITKGLFISRPNRFIAKVAIGDKEHTVHVKNTGRCKELLIPGCSVYLTAADNPNRKTKYDLIAVEKQRKNNTPLLINMDSQIVNSAAEEWLKKGELFGKEANIRREVTWGNSRFDFYIETGNKKIFLEVKGVTLEQDGIAMFPDAPTERGIKHINELIKAKSEGFDSYILFIIQMKEIKEFIPNDLTHPAFGAALKKAQKAGVNILAMDCIITPDTITVDKEVKCRIF